MRKLLSVMAAVTVLVSFASCGGKSETSTTGNQTYSVEKLNGVSYKKEKLKTAENMSQVYCFNPYNNMNDYLLLGSSTRTPEFWHANADFSEYEVREFEDFEVGVNYNIDVANDGTLVEFVIHADYGDLPPLGLYESPEDYDEEEYDAVAEYSFLIKTFSADGKILSSAELTDFPVEADKSVSIGGIYSDGKLLIADLNGTYEMFTIDGKYLGEFKADEAKRFEIGHDSEGNLICALTYKNGDDGKLKFCKIDSEGKLSDYNNTEYDYTGTISEVRSGNGDYSIFLQSATNIYGVRKDDNKMECLFDLASSGVGSNSIQGYLMMDDGNMAVMSNNFTSYSVNFRKFIPRTQEEIDNMKIVTLGVESGDLFTTECVNEWNDEGHDFTIEIKQYDSDYNNRENTMNQLAQDILSDNMPDMMFSFTDYFCDVDLAGKGAYEDIYSLIDKDSEFSRDSFVPNVLNCLETDGCLYTIPNRFMVDLGRVAKKKFVPSAAEWNNDAEIDMILNPPIDSDLNSWYINEDSKMSRMSMMDVASWIDAGNATCHYTDESFIKYLNYCNGADVVKTERQSMTEEEWEVYINSDEFQKEVEESREKAYLEDKAYIDDTHVFSRESIYTYSGYHQFINGKFNGEPLTYLEKPVIDAYGSYGICKSSENKDLCWEYIKSFMTDDYYKSTIEQGPLPITKSGIKIYADHELNQKYDWSYLEKYKDYDGDMYAIHRGDHAEDWEYIKIGRLTQDIIDEADDIISKCVPNKDIPLENKVYEILYEEIEKFFYGDYTAERCAEVIQSRLSIFLAERS